MKKCSKFKNRVFRFVTQYFFMTYISINLLVSFVFISKNSAKGKIKQIKSPNNHSANTARNLILEEAFTTENGGKINCNSVKKEKKENSYPTNSFPKSFLSLLHFLPIYRSSRTSVFFQPRINDDSINLNRIK